MRYSDRHAHETESYEQAITGEVIGQTWQITGPWFKRDVESGFNIIYNICSESNFWSKWFVSADFYTQET